MESRVIDTNLVDSVVSLDWEFGHVCCSAKANENVPRIFTQLVRQKIQLERLEMERNGAGNGNDSESDGGGSEAENSISPLSRASISSSERLFFGNSLDEHPHHQHHGSFSFGSSHSLESGGVDSRKSSISDSELEFRLKNGFKNGSNCIIS